jgi:enamidase
VKVRAGAPILELGLEEQDFAEMAAGGVTLVGEIGLGSVKTGAQAAPMVAWAKQHGMTVTFHTGGPSIAAPTRSPPMPVLEARPHIVGHVNGGTTPMSDADIARVVDTDMAIEIVHCGNGRAALVAVRRRRELDRLGSVIIGNDAPSGTGVVPLGILRVMAHLASLGDVAPEIAVAMATGQHRARPRARRRRARPGAPRTSCCAMPRSARRRRPRSRRSASATCPASRWC